MLDIAAGSTTTKHKIGPIWFAAGLVLITVAAYSAVGTFGSINLDDAAYVYNNDVVRQGLSWNGVRWAFASSDAGNWHPLTWLSHMLDVQLLGLDPGPHHLVNLLLHVASTLLLFGFLWRATDAVGRSAFVAALFAIHPLHVESVAWVAERKDVLSTLFFMLTLWAYSAYTAKRTVARYLLVFLALGFGLMAKPMLVTVPFLLLLLDIWPFKRLQFSDFDGTVAFKLALEKLPLLALAAGSSIVTFYVQREWGAMVNLEMAPLGLRLSNAIVAYIAYIGHLIWPMNLAAMYPYASFIPIWKTVAALFLLVVLSVASVLAVRRYPYLPVGWFWYLGTLVPVIGIVQVGVQSMADRYTYVPMIGLSIIVAWGGYDLLGRHSRRQMALSTLAVLLVAMLATMTWVQAGYWVDSKTLWKRTLAVTRDNFMAHLLYGRALSDAGEPREALAQFQKALALQPRSAEAAGFLADTLSSLGRPGDAITQYEQSLQADPNYAPALNGLGNALARAGRFDEAAAQFRKALAVNPLDAFAHNGLGSALDELGMAEEAIDHYRTALSIDPDFAAAHANLASALAGQGQIDDAVKHMQAALKQDPSNPLYHYNFALLAESQGKVGQAIEHLERAVQLDPKNQALRQALEDIRRRK